MNKKLLFLILFLAVIVLPVVALAAQDGAPAGGVDPIFLRIKTAFIAIGTTIVVIGWIITGILYLTAGGGERLATAKKSLVACVIGTAVIVLATTIESTIRYYLIPT